ncbi:Uma2 family endonuclease [Laspinema olomoucense]|uniref:Uma2 family endonuclease n=1 Tax=Laspinema olomoucense TaxID=3231600 RepID=UPI0021BB1CE3|nr:Uma2 family endonuclease [Laspinema sp. D3c]MCT7994083.1 Uma2 family endonuclease [Laspinema sp. D3c]
MNTLVTDKLCSFEDYLQYDDGTDNRYELVKGRLELMNPRTIRHLLIADFIGDSLKAEINRKQLPWLCFKEAGVRTGLQKCRVTDLCVVLQEQALDLLDKSAVFQTPPLLVVEVVSPESINRDYGYKRSEYAAAEIVEYWIVDPILNQLSLLRLEEGFYEETILTATQPIVSQVFPELTLTVDQVLAAGNIGA